MTELEKDFIQGFQEDDVMYLDHVEGYMKKVTNKQVPGVLTSLLKKGLVERWMDDEFKMTVVSLTEEGKKHLPWQE